MNDPHDNEQTDSKMMRRYIQDSDIIDNLAGQSTDDDTAEIESIVQEIMAGMEHWYPNQIEEHIREVLTRHVRVANAAYEEVPAKEERHVPQGFDLFEEHGIYACNLDNLDYCRRYPGQRRDSK